MRNLYSILFYLALPFIFLRLIWKGRKIPGYRQRWPQRLGFIPEQKPGTIWLHAVSLGELIAARPLINALRKNFPKYPVLITNMTASGAGLAAQMANDDIKYAYLPYDVPTAVNRFLDRAQPKLAVIMETELWPNLIHYTAKRGIPILIANARLSERSCKGYRKIKFLTEPLLQDITVIAAQTQADAQRFIDLGASAAKTPAWGNIKFDVPYPEELVAKGRALRQSWGEPRPILIAASTHGGEEEKVLTAFAQLRESYPQALLILVPRHPERFDEVAALCQKRGFSTVRRSQNLPCSPETAVFVGDSLGEMFVYYAAADIAFVGGSFAPIGGHNLLEPAALGLPIITGPNMMNFVEITQLLTNASALINVEDENGLLSAWRELLADKSRQQQMGQNAQQVVADNKGALERHVNFIGHQLQMSPLS